MNKRIFFLAGLLCLLIRVNSQSQIPIEYAWTRFKWEFPPLEPLPTGKTFNLGLPDGLAYLQNKVEVRPYWNPLGLILENKWDEKNATDFTFKFEMEGIKISKVETEERSSNRTITRREFFRHYTFSFAAKLTVVDNATNEVIRTVTIVPDDEAFQRIFHRNFFIDLSVDPNYKKEVGFDSLKQLKRISEMDSKILKHLEGEFASEIIFERIKTVLVHLYGKQILKAEFAVLNPKTKNRKHDFSDYDAASQKLKQAFEIIKVNPADQSYLSLLDDAEKFYLGVIQNTDSRFEDDVPAMAYWNLTEIKLLKNDFEKADEYFEKVKNSRKPEGSFSTFWVPAYQSAKGFFQLRKLIVTESRYLKQ